MASFLFLKIICIRGALLLLWVFGRIPSEPMWTRSFLLGRFEMMDSTVIFCVIRPVLVSFISLVVWLSISIFHNYFPRVVHNTFLGYFNVCKICRAISFLNFWSCIYVRFLTALWRYPSTVFLLRSQLTFHFRCFKGNMPFFPLAAIKILLLCLIFSGFIMMYLGWISFFNLSFQYF